MLKGADLTAELSAKGQGAFAPLAAAARDGRALAAASLDAARDGEIFSFRSFEGAFDFLRETADTHKDWIGWEHVTAELRCGGQSLLVDCPAGCEDPNIG